jgi:transcriptional regulator with XRE-family HTH domain/plasmid maintenance system antidote protein VapI
MPSMKKIPEVQRVVERIRRNMRRWGISVSFLARQLDVTRQYAWQIVHYRTPLSVDRALEIEKVIDGIIARRMHLRTFGDRLRAARVSAGLTLKEVGEMIGYTWVGVERWEKNVCRPKPGVLWHLCSVYGIPIVSLAAGGVDAAAMSSAAATHPGIRAELAASLASGGPGGLLQATSTSHAGPIIPSRTQAA